MRVLYVLDDFPQLSESYVLTELRWVIDNGVEVSVWATRRPKSACPTSLSASYECEITLSEMVNQFKPDVIHVHWLFMGLRVLRELEELERPVTVRGHSFDHSKDRVEGLLASPCVKRVFLFPHFVNGFVDARVRVLPVSYNADLYYPQEKDWTRIVRTGAGKPGKAIEEFLDIASKVRDHFRSVLVITSNQKTHYHDKVEALNRELGYPAELHIDLSFEETASIVRACGVLLRGHDPGAHPYGMPISVAEAMGTGAYVVSRDDPSAREYIADAGGYFSTAEEAVSILKRTLTWERAETEAAHRRSWQRAARYRTDVVLPALISEWEAVAGES